MSDAPDADARPPDADIAPAERLRARAVTVDRAARFEHRLEAVHEQRRRRRTLRIVGRVGWAVAFAAVAALTPIVLAAVVGGDDPDGSTLLLAALVGAVLGGIGPSVRERIARRRGPAAWDAYHERHVLIGDPSVGVRDADRPRGGPGVPPPPGL